MSGAMRIAKYGYRGDPGLFGDIGKFIGGAVKGVAGGLLTGNPIAAIGGGVMGGISALKGAPKAPSAAIQMAGSVAGNGKPLNPSINIASAGFFPSGTPQMPQMGNQQQIGLINFGGSGPGKGNQTQAGWPGVHSGNSSTAGLPCLKGHHVNKTGYYRKGGPRSNFAAGWVEAGTVCVKNRRRNPLNPRAASRAMARLASAKNAARFLGSFSIKGGCGCNGKR